MALLRQAILRRKPSNLSEPILWCAPPVGLISLRLRNRFDALPPDRQTAVRREARRLYRDMVITLGRAWRIALYHDAYDHAALA